MAQYLALPLNTAEINAGYKTYAPGYNLNGTLATHYGVDWIGYTYSSDRRFFASGNGTVMGINTSGSYVVGKWVAVKYTNVSGYGDLIVRYYHMERIDVTKGQSVTMNTVLGVYGTTDTYSSGNHIHTEVDTDTTNWQYTPTLSSNSGCGLKAGARGKGDHLWWLLSECRTNDCSLFSHSWYPIEKPDSR